MKNYLFNQTATTVTSTKTVNGLSQNLSDEAFYLIALVSQLKKMLGPDVQHYFPVSENSLLLKNNVMK